MSNINPLKKIIIVVLIIIIAIGGYFALKTKQQPVQTSVITQTTPTSTSNTTDETANWKTYTNVKYSYEIKYPIGAELTTVDLSAGVNGIHVVKEFTSDVPSIQIKVENAFVEILSKGDQVNFGPAGHGIQRQESSIIIDGKKYTAVSDVIDVSGYSSKTTSVISPTVQILYGYAPQGTRPLTKDQIKEAEAEINQILSTFKFLK